MRARHTRRGMILLVVLVVVSIAALAGVSATYLASAEVASATGSMRRIQSRSLAWSGIQGIMAELAQQREAILQGEEPTITPEWELFVDGAGRRAIVRIIPDAAGRELTSEQTKLDVNTATAEMLAAAGIEETLASAIVAARGRQPFSSIGALLGVEGMTPELLFGDAWDAAGDGAHDDGSFEAGDFETEGISTSSLAADPRSASAAPGGLADLLTVFSFDPNIQSSGGRTGIATGSGGGERRININTPWTDELGEEVTDRIGPEAAARLRAFISTDNNKFDTLGACITLAQANAINPETLAEELDALTISGSPFVPGRIDLNLAPAEILACIPGISADAAERIVDVRESLSDESRRSIVWPLAEGILTTEDMALAADHLTTRSCQWRVTIEGGFAPADDGQSWDQLADVELSDRIVLEAVIDIASSRPRLAYLRDISLLPVARQLAAEAGAVLAEEESRIEVIDNRPPPAPRPPPSPPAGDLDSPAAPAGGFGTRAGRQPPSGTIPEPAGMGPIEPDAADAATEADSAPTGDPRIGRWTPGRARKDGP